MTLKADKRRDRPASGKPGKQDLYTCGRCGRTASRKDGCGWCGKGVKGRVMNHG